MEDTFCIQGEIITAQGQDFPSLILHFAFCILHSRRRKEAVLQNRLDQDHLVSFLKREDAGELPEVGLQAAATRLSQVLFQRKLTSTASLA
jgi:hypothetical protein